MQLVADKLLSIFLFVVLCFSDITVYGDFAMPYYAIVIANSFTHTHYAFGWN